MLNPLADATNLNERRRSWPRKHNVRGLGRGLAALIGDVGTEAAPREANAAPRRAPLEHLRPNPRNPRRNFADAELDELARLDPAQGPDSAGRGAARRAASRHLTRSWRASDAGGPRNGPGSPRYRSCWSRSTTELRSNLRSSRTCNAKTSMRSRRQPVIKISSMNTIIHKLNLLTL